MKTAKIDDKIWVAANVHALMKTRKLPVSYHLARQLEEKGYVEPVFKKSKNGGRDRKEYVVAAKGKKLLEVIQKFH